MSTDWGSRQWTSWQRTTPSRRRRARSWGPAEGARAGCPAGITLNLFSQAIHSFQSGSMVVTRSEDWPGQQLYYDYNQFSSPAWWWRNPGLVCGRTGRGVAVGDITGQLWRGEVHLTRRGLETVVVMLSHLSHVPGRTELGGHQLVLHHTTHTFYTPASLCNTTQLWLCQNFSVKPLGYR